MRTKLADRFWLGFGSLFSGGLTYLMFVCLYNIMMGLITYFATDPWWVLSFGIVVTGMAIIAIPIAVFITIMFTGWTFGKDIFKIEGDKYDQVEFNFKEK